MNEPDVEPQFDEEDAMRSVLVECYGCTTECKWFDMYWLDVGPDRRVELVCASCAPANSLTAGKRWDE